MIAWPAALGAAGASLASPAQASSTHAPSALVPPAPEEVAVELPAARLQGQATMRYLGFEIYEARLWTAPDFSPTHYASHAFALELRYALRLDGAAIAERSLAEMRRVGSFDDARAKGWREMLGRALPDVEPGDRLTGVRAEGGTTRFYRNGQPTAVVEDAEFARLFFGIWLSPRTSEPALRRGLIGAGR
ncbi:MAG: chalcone isomerase family protein [Rhizobacter sp.]|nr:chalcone isomerase family protein [Rhizobacter sp.]